MCEKNKTISFNLSNRKTVNHDVTGLSPVRGAKEIAKAVGFFAAYNGSSGVV